MASTNKSLAQSNKSRTRGEATKRWNRAERSKRQITMMKRTEYLDLRRLYEPQGLIRLVIIAESPPASGKYFYNPRGATSEWLFAALMKQIGFSPSTKEKGLREFQRRGWILVDATYEPVNKGLPNSARNKVIERDYPLLRDDLATFTPDRSAPLVLIKANVCQILKPKLVQDGFNVLNRDDVVPFPSTGQQPKFYKRFGAILRSAEVSTARS